MAQWFSLCPTHPRMLAETKGCGFARMYQCVEYIYISVTLSVSCIYIFFTFFPCLWPSCLNVLYVFYALTFFILFLYPVYEVVVFHNFIDARKYQLTFGLVKSLKVTNLYYCTVYTHTQYINMDNNNKGKNNIKSLSRDLWQETARAEYSIIKMYMYIVAQGILGTPQNNARNNSEEGFQRSIPLYLYYITHIYRYRYHWYINIHHSRIPRNTMCDVSPLTTNYTYSLCKFILLLQVPPLFPATDCGSTEELHTRPCWTHSLLPSKGKIKWVLSKKNMIGYLVFIFSNIQAFLSSFFFLQKPCVSPLSNIGWMLSIDYMVSCWVSDPLFFFFSFFLPCRFFSFSLFVYIDPQVK